MRLVFSLEICFFLALSDGQSRFLNCGNRRRVLDAPVYLRCYCCMTAPGCLQLRCYLLTSFRRMLGQRQSTSARQLPFFSLVASPLHLRGRRKNSDRTLPKTSSNQDTMSKTSKRAASALHSSKQDKQLVAAARANLNVQPSKAPRSGFDRSASSFKYSMSPFLVLQSFGRANAASPSTAFTCNELIAARNVPSAFDVHTGCRMPSFSYFHGPQSEPFSSSCAP